jgi:hypothetical protein
VEAAGLQGCCSMAPQAGAVCAARRLVPGELVSRSSFLKEPVHRVRREGPSKAIAAMPAGVLATLQHPESSGGR